MLLGFNRKTKNFKWAQYLEAIPAPEMEFVRNEKQHEKTRKSLSNYRRCVGIGNKESICRRNEFKHGWTNLCGRKLGVELGYQTYVIPNLVGIIRICMMNWCSFRRPFQLSLCQQIDQTFLSKCLADDCYSKLINSISACDSKKYAHISGLELFFANEKLEPKHTLCSAKRFHNPLLRRTI
jgi:hypothetical protein